MVQTSFEFVMQEGPKRFSRVTQTKIRRQAMKAVGLARRQTERYGKHNLRQGSAVTYTKTESELSPTAVPIGVLECDKRIAVHSKRSKHGGRREDRYPKEENTHAAIDETVAMALNKLSSSMFVSGLEQLMMDFNVEPADLSALTSIHITAVASAVLTTQPGRLKDLLSSRQWSYFEHLYSRFGHSACLDDSVRCLIMVAQELMAPSSRTPRRVILTQYGRALRSLQKAIDAPGSRADPDTLCATNMLQLFSVLYPAACTAETWSQHLTGSMRMIELRGPHDFKTDYEKALLIAAAGTITTETFYRNQVSFLEEPEWQKAILACKLETDLFSDRSSLAIDLGALMVKLPGACKRVGDVVCSTNPSPAAITTARQEVRQLRKALRQWRNLFDTELIIDPPPASVPPSQRYKRLDALANALVLEVVLARLAGSVQVSERFAMEDEIQQHGAHIASMEASCYARDYRTAFYLSQKYVIAAALMETSHLWRAPCSSSGELIEAWKFRAWCDAVPRQSPLG